MAEERKIRSEKDDAVSQEAVMALEKENRVAQYRGHIAKLISFIAICFSLFQLYTGIFGVLDAQLQRAVHLGFGLVLVFLLYPTRKTWLNRASVHPLDAFLALLAASGPLYIITQYHDLVLRAGNFNTLDMAVGSIGVLLVIEAARRVVGIPMV